MCLAVPGKILEIAGDVPLERTARVAFGSLERRVNLAYVPEAAVGDYVLVHVGFAIGRLDPAAAAETLALIAGLDAAP